MSVEPNGMISYINIQGRDKTLLDGPALSWENNIIQSIYGCKIMYDMDLVDEGKLIVDETVLYKAEEM